MEFWSSIVYEDKNYILLWKAAWLASSRGETQSVLDQIRSISTEDTLWIHQNRIFWPEQEYGLLNRLDTPTVWLLYFAKSLQAKKEYQVLQNSKKIQKIYYAKVYGTPRANFWRISTPLFHHKNFADRMTWDPHNGRGKEQQVISYREKINPTQAQEFCDLKIIIHSWCRHQIRVHLASIGHPIVDDNLYMTKGLKKRYGRLNKEKIELMSAGIEIKVI